MILKILRYQNEICIVKSLFKNHLKFKSALKMIDFKQKWGRFFFFETNLPGRENLDTICHFLLVTITSRGAKEHTMHKMHTMRTYTRNTRKYMTHTHVHNIWTDEKNNSYIYIHIYTRTYIYTYLRSFSLISVETFFFDHHDQKERSLLKWEKMNVSMCIHICTCIYMYI